MAKRNETASTVPATQMSKRSSRGTTSGSSTATRAVNLRVKEEVRDLIDAAAQAQHRSRSDFMIEAARAAAQESILSRTVFALDPARSAAFLAKLDAPPAENAQLRKTMLTLSPWEMK